MARRLKIPYGIKDFKRIREEGYYYVDKTAYIRKMEERDSFVFFVRPRRMGKSLFVQTLRCYYDVNEKANFKKLFGGLDIGESPTENANKYHVLSLDFSVIGGIPGATLEENFESYLSTRLDGYLLAYGSAYGEGLVDKLADRSAAEKFNAISTRARLLGHEIYLIIDEYDNFTNTMLRSEASRDYRAVTHGAGFYRSWFKKFKEACSRIFMTGVSPVTMDDLTSGFNIAANLTQLPAFNAMVGFSEAEVVKMYSDFKGVGEFTEGDPAEIVRSIKPWYDGYCFATAKIGRECVFNSDMALYYLKALVNDGAPPENMVDANIRTDYEKLKIIADIQRQHKYCVVTGSCAVQNSDGQDCAIATATAFPDASAADASASAPASSAAAQATAQAADQAFPSEFCIASAPASSAAAQATAQAADQAFPSGFCIPPDAAAPASACAVSESMGVLPITEQLATTGEISFDLVESFERVHYGDASHSYLIELKYARAEASEEEMAEKVAEAKAQLAKYRADPSVPSLARGTTLHQIVYVFRGTALHVLEQISCETMAWD